jgi:hypothetical protein
MRSLPEKLFPFRAAAGLACALLILLSVSAASAQTGGGRKYAIVIGINNYPNLPAENQLHQAVKDANNARQMLISEFDFPAENIVMLYDTEATRDGILQNLRNQLSKLKAGDLFVFYYSGHGTLFPDAKSEEIDETQITDQIVDPETKLLKPLAHPAAFDSAICPSNVAGPSEGGKPWGNLILDDELYNAFKEFTTKGCQVVLLSDSCHSGSLGRGLSEANGDRPKQISPRLLFGEVNDWESGIPRPAVQTQVQRTNDDFDGRYLAFTAAKDSELAWESQTGGYFTEALVTAARGSNNHATFECLFRAVKRQVKTRQPNQEPQLDTRFFRGAPTNTLFLNYAAPAELKVLLKVIDENGKPLAGAALIIFRASVSPGPTITADDALLLGRTDFGGLYDSGCPQVAAGTYWVKVMKDGYRVHQVRTVLKANAPGVAALSVRLEKLN